MKPSTSWNPKSWDEPNSPEGSSLVKSVDAKRNVVTFEGVTASEEIGRVTAKPYAVSDCTKLEFVLFNGNLMCVKDSKESVQ